jgi:IclR family pca regulon transcriptional regulator
MSVELTTGVSTGAVASDRKEYVLALEKGLMVLTILAGATSGMTLSQVAAACGTSRASARRFLLTLTELGFVAQTGREFELTAKVLSLGARRFDRGLLWQAVLPQMQALSDQLNESCSAAVRDGADIVYVARVAASRIMSVNLEVGSRLPAAHTSMGRVILADLPEDALSQFLAQAPLPAKTGQTLTDPATLARAIGKSGAEGYALIDQELELGLRSIAVPLRDAAGRVFAGLNVSAQAARVTTRHMVQEFLPKLKETATRIEALRASL